jgi:hypothetical protein
MTGIKEARRRTGLYAVSALALAAMLTAPSLAAGQSPDICAQYPDDPQCQPPDTGGGNPPGTTSPGTDNGAVNPASGGASLPPGSVGPTGHLSKGSGTLPFTGYPISPLVLFALLLILLGLIIRGGSAAGRRALDRRAGPGPPQPGH